MKRRALKIIRWALRPACRRADLAVHGQLWIWRYALRAYYRADMAIWNSPLPRRSMIANRALHKIALFCIACRMRHLGNWIEHRIPLDTRVAIYQGEK